MQKKDTGKKVHKLVTKKRGRPELLLQKVMEKIITLIKALRLEGTPVKANVINAIARPMTILSFLSMEVTLVSANTGEETS